MLRRCVKASLFTSFHCGQPSKRASHNAFLNSKWVLGVSTLFGLPLYAYKYIKVVILGVWRLTGEQAGGLAYYPRRKPGALDIFSKYSLKISRVYSNMLEYTQIYSNISLSGRRRDLPGGLGGRADAQTILKYIIYIFTFVMSSMAQKMRYHHLWLQL
jgi:hypothetical protein